MGIARLLQTYINSHIDTEKSKPIKDEGSLLPHPQIWKDNVGTKGLDISSETARDILHACNSWLDSSHAALLDDWMENLNYIAKQ